MNKENQIMVCVMSSIFISLIILYQDASQIVTMACGVMLLLFMRHDVFKGVGIRRENFNSPLMIIAHTFFILSFVGLHSSFNLLFDKIYLMMHGYAIPQMNPDVDNEPTNVEFFYSGLSAILTCATLFLVHSTRKKKIGLGLFEKYDVEGYLNPKVIKYAEEGRKVREDHRKYFGLVKKDSYEYQYEKTGNLERIISSTTGELVWSKNE